ncbi:TPA: hypothetical protein ACH3X1_004841 [Trebouxia sp. C0004]
MADFQLQILLNFQGDWNEFQEMSDAANKRDRWLCNLSNKSYKQQSGGDRLGKSEEYVQEAFATALRRGLEYELQEGRSMSLWGRTYRPSDLPRSLAYFVVHSQLYSTEPTGLLTVPRAWHQSCC